MNFCIKGVLLVLLTIVIAGCAKTEVTHQEVQATDKLARPQTIWVYDFVATSDDMPIHTSLDKEHFSSGPPQTAEHIAEGRKLGAEIQTELVKQLRDKGILAQHAITGSKMQLSDVALQGYILSYDEGDAKKRVAIGLGKGSSHMQAVIESFQLTANGFRLIGSGTMDSGSDKTPGGVVGLAVLAATKNPAGLIVSTGMHVYNEKTGKSTVEGRAEQIAEHLAERVEKKFEEQGWL